MPARVLQREWLQLHLSEHASKWTVAVEIGVLDNGPGIEGELASRLFDPLTTTKQDGLGLGLSICASIMEAHGGRVWLHSGKPGATEFRFSVPLDRSRER